MSKVRTESYVGPPVGPHEQCLFPQSTPAFRDVVAIGVLG
jgi:hypothetical protein